MFSALQSLCTRYKGYNVAEFSAQSNDTVEPSQTNLGAVSVEGDASDKENEDDGDGD